MNRFFSLGVRCWILVASVLGLVFVMEHAHAQSDSVFLKMKSEGVVDWNRRGYWEPKPSAKSPILIADTNLVIRDRFYSNGVDVVVVANTVDMKVGSVIATGYGSPAEQGLDCGWNGKDGKRAGSFLLVMVQANRLNIDANGQQGGPGAKGCKGNSGADSTIASENGGSGVCKVKVSRFGEPSCTTKSGENGVIPSGNGGQGEPGKVGGSGGVGGDAGINLSILASVWSASSANLSATAYGGLAGVRGDGGEGGKGGEPGPKGVDGDDCTCHDGYGTAKGGRAAGRGKSGPSGHSGLPGGQGLSGKSSSFSIEVLEPSRIKTLIEEIKKNIYAIHFDQQNRPATSPPPAQLDICEAKPWLRVCRWEWEVVRSIMN